MITFNENLKVHFRAYRNNLTHLIKRSKYNYFRNKINDSLHNPKLFWRTLNEITGRNKNSNDFPINSFFEIYHNLGEQEKTILVADQFNEHFSKVGERLASNILDPGVAAVVDDADFRCDSRLTLHTVTEHDVRRQVLGLRGGSAPGYCKISASFLRDNVDLFIKPLTHIVNLSIRLGIFPESFKIAKVFPLFKAGQKCDLNNYRPISLLSVFSKVLEKIIKEQLTKYLNDNSILSNRQYGFRQGKNISNALFDLNKEIHNTLIGHKKMLLVFLDLAKAFDSVDRSLLLKKLKLIGITDTSYNWFETYLSNRKQFVSLSGISGSTASVEYGVVQGSTLGPLLFLIYINNLSKLTTNGTLYLFADDTALCVSGDNWDRVYENASEDLSKLKLWFDQNVLTLNISKTKCLPLSLREIKKEEEKFLKLHSCGVQPNFVCSCKTLENVTKYKYLGIIFDGKLKWSEHIQFIKKKIRKLIYFFSQFRFFLSIKEMRNVYFAYVQSLLEGGIIAWGGAYQTTLEPLLTTQKLIMKLALNKNVLYPSNEIFREFNVLDVRQLYIKNILVYIFHNYESIFTVINHNYGTRASTAAGVITPRSTRTFSVTNVYYAAHIIYRNIPNELKNFESCKITSYKKKIIKWLLSIGRDSANTLLNSIYT